MLYIRSMGFPGILRCSVLILLLMSGIHAAFLTHACAEEQLDIKKEKDRTVYTIGSSPEQKDEDKDKAWEMLKNIRIDTRGEDGKGPDTRR